MSSNHESDEVRGPPVTSWRDLRREYIESAEDSRRWLVASMLTITAGSLALLFAAGYPTDYRGIEYVTAGSLLAASLVSGVGSVLAQFVSASKRAQQIGHAIAMEEGYSLYDVMLKANDRAPPERKKETYEASERQKEKADNESTLMSKSGLQAFKWGRYASPLAVAQTLTWLVGFFFLLWAL